MGLLPVDTVFVEEKTRTRVSGTFHCTDGIFGGLCGDDIQAEGYEIHMGQSTLKEGAKPLMTITDSVSGETKEDGAYCSNVFGSYVHGIFDGDGIGAVVVKALAMAKGVEMEDVATVSYKEYKERQYDILADSIRANLDMEQIYRILEEGL